MNALVSMDPFNGDPLKTQIKNLSVEYLSFSRPKTAHKAPVVFLGGIFHGIQSFKKEVELLSDVYPVLLIDLPGQGNNHEDAADLSFEDFADILCNLLDEMGIDKVSPITLSDSSLIGYIFASKYPERVDKLVLGGVTRSLRESVKKSLEKCFNSLNCGELEGFSASVVLNWFNFYRRHEIKGSEVLQKSIYKKLLSLEAIDLYRFESNVRRLLANEKLPKAPTCETLFLAGEFDSFITPAETFEVAQYCSYSTFGILKNCDHLLPFENEKLVNKLCKKFLAGVPINGTSGVKIFKQRDYPVTLQRLEPRYELKDIGFIEVGRSYYPVNIINISTGGVMLGKLNGAPKIDAGSLKLTLPNGGLEIEVELVDHKQETVRGIFVKNHFDTCLGIENFIINVAISEDGFCGAA